MPLKSKLTHTCYSKSNNKKYMSTNMIRYSIVSPRCAGRAGQWETDTLSHELLEREMP